MEETGMCCSKTGCCCGCVCKTCDDDVDDIYDDNYDDGPCCNCLCILKCLCRTLVASLCILGLLGLIVITIDNVIPTTIDPEPYTLPPAPVFEGVLEQNKRLQSAVWLYEDVITGPESLILHQNHIYTGTADGKIVAIDMTNDQFKELAYLGKTPCEGNYEDEPRCGRPMGMRADGRGYLLVVDAYLGLFRVHMPTGAQSTLLSNDTLVNGKAPTFLSDLTLDAIGNIYMTDSSTRWDRRDTAQMMMEARPTGRVIKYDIRRQQATELVSGLYTPDGIQISHDGSQLFIAESCRARITRFYLRGNRAGQTDIFYDNLPGIPGNIRLGSSGYWVGLTTVRKSGTLSALDLLAPRPWLRNFISKVLKREWLISLLYPSYGLVVEIDYRGNIVRMLYDPEGDTVFRVSEAIEHNGALYISSSFASFIAKLDL